MMEFEDRLRTHLQERAAEFEVPARQLEVTPHPRPSRSRAIATTVAAVTILASVVGVSLASNSGDPTEETSDLALELPARAGLLADPPNPSPTRTEWSWALAPGIEATQLFEMDDGTILAFGAADPATNRGIRAWSLGSDGRLLEALGTVVGVAYETPTIHQAENLVAIGLGSPWTDQFPELAGGTLLVSDDGRAWQDFPLPMVREPPYATAELVATGGGRVLVRTVGLAADASSASGSEFADSAFDFQMATDERGEVIVVIAELDLPVDTVPAGTLPDTEQTPRFWATEDYVNWSEITMPELGAPIESWTGFFDGNHYVVTATGFDGTRRFLTSVDLVTWEVAGESRALHDVQPLADVGYLAQQDGLRRPNLFISADLEAWVPMTDPEAGQPSAAYTDAVDEGGFGVALAFANPVEAPSSFFVVRTEGLVTMFDRTNSEIVVWGDQGAVFETSFLPTEHNPAIEYSPSSDSLVIKDPDGGGVFVELPARDVVAAMRAEDFVPEYNASLLVYPVDEEKWTLIDFTIQTGGSGPVRDVLVTDEWVFVAYGPSAASPAQVWAGHLITTR